MKKEHIQDLYRHDLSSFMQFAFNVLNHSQSVYQHNWHVDLMAHYLSQVSDGKIKRLIINMPPRTLKSHCVSGAWTAWSLGRNPYQKILCLHAGNALGQDLHENCQNLMLSPRYRSLFDHVQLKVQRRCLRTSFGGQRQFMPMMGRLTGLGADIVIIDDPISASDARDPLERRRLNEQFDDNILQRLNDKKTGAIVLVMQRLHDDDLTGHLLQKNDGWVHLNLPAVALQDETWSLPHGRIYHRKKGEALHEDRESIETLLGILNEIGGYAFSQQYLQGAYKPVFGESGRGGLFLTPYRKGVFWDARKEPRGLHGFYRFDERDLILPNVFGIGDNPYPDDMRNSLDIDEWLIAGQETMKYQERVRKELGL